MDAKTLTEDAERYQDKIRELSLAKLSEPIRVLDEEGGREFNVTSYYDLYWLSPGTLLYVNDGYFMRSGLIAGSRLSLTPRSARVSSSFYSLHM